MERRALNALKALKQNMRAEIIALRDGAGPDTQRYLLRIGNIEPADVQLLQGDNSPWTNRR